MATRELADAATELQKGFIKLKEEYVTKYPGRGIIITCVYRSPEEQCALYQLGRTVPGKIVTFKDGVRSLSKHNLKPAKAIDVAITINGKVCWEEKYYEDMGSLAPSCGLTWGGSWKRFKDNPHLEIA